MDEDWIKVSWNKETGAITLTDASGRVVDAKGALIVAHNQEAQHGIFIAKGEAREIAEGFAQGYLRAGDDPWYLAFWKTLAFRMHLATQAQRNGMDLLGKWEGEKDTFH